MKWDAATTKDSRRPGCVYTSTDAGRKAGLLFERTHIPFIITVALAITATLLLFPAYADDDAPTPESEQPVVLEEIIVEGELPSDEEPEQDLSAFGQVIFADELPGIALSISDAVESAIGLQVRDFGGLGKLSSITLRGLSSNDVLIMLDGIPLNSAALGGVDLGDIPFASVERIEIIRGAEAALYGDNSAGGIVNIVRKTGEENAHLGLTAGSFGLLTGDLSFSTNNESTGMFARMYGTSYGGGFPFLNDNGTSLDESDDFTDTRVNNGYAGYGFFGGVNSSCGRWDISSTIDLYSARKGIPGLLTFPTPDAVQHDRRLMCGIRGGDDEIAGGLGELDFNLGFLDTHRSFDDPSGGAGGVPISDSWRESRLAAGAEYAEFIGDTHYISLGAEWSRGSFNRRDALSVSRNELGLYARDEITIGDSILIPALRFDDISDAGSRLSPKIGWRCGIDDNITVKANCGAAFRAPTFEEMFRDEGFVIGNPELKPEKSWMADTGFIFRDEQIKIELDYFLGESCDLIEYILGTGFRYRPLNIGNASISGVEASFAWDIGDAWRFETNASYTRALDKTEPGGTAYGMQIPGRPRYDAYAGLIFDEPSRDFSAHLTAYYAGGRYLTAANTKKLDDDVSFNAGFASSQWWDCIVSFEVKNLFDTNLMDVRGFPLPGRTLLVSIDMEV